ncbi:hypothetical protein R3P38DRAFT_3453074 [Favolaschia claudopus]|uniref:GATA-type domain-containing protein n=1 Tax=Favolaschia claudopus TaxID=2862362 RepID=A0AAW0CQN6_9AGAR
MINSRSSIFFKVAHSFICHDSPFVSVGANNQGGGGDRDGHARAASVDGFTGPGAPGTAGAGVSRNNTREFGASGGVLIPVSLPAKKGTLTPAGSIGAGAAVQGAGGVPGAPFPPTNAANQRICRQCGLPGRYKEGKCVEKWGPGPLGPGTVCDRCRKKMKRVERRGTLEQQLAQAQAAAAAAAAGGANAGASNSPAPATHNATPSRNNTVQRTDTLPVSAAAPESSIRSSLASSSAVKRHTPGSATPGRVIKSRLTPAPSASTSTGTSAGGHAGAPGLLPPLRTHSPMEVDEDGEGEGDSLDAGAEAEVDEDVSGAAGGGGEGDGDPEADLLEAVDAAEKATVHHSTHNTHVHANGHGHGHGVHVAGRGRKSDED